MAPMARARMMRAAALALFVTVDVIPPLWRKADREVLIEL
jgi:hypothetical protein